VVAAFAVWPVALFYIIAMGALCLHLSHGIWSMLQTLGWNTARNETTLKIISRVIAIAVVRWIHLRSCCSDGRLAALKETHMLEARIPSGPIEQQWDKCRSEMKLVNPANRRKHSIIVVGAGLAGAAAAATLASKATTSTAFPITIPRARAFHRRQGGINAAKNYPQRRATALSACFMTPSKGGDFRAREANVYRLAQISVQYHRPMRRPRRAVCQGVWRTPRHAIVWRRAGPTHVLRARSDGTAALARGVSGLGRAGGSRTVTMHYPQ